MKIILFYISLFFLTAGCLATIQMKPINPALEQVYSVDLGSEKTSNIGDAMVSKSDALVFSGFTAISDFQPSQAGMLSFEKIQAGSKWYVIGQLDDGSYIIKNDDYMKSVHEFPKFSTGIVPVQTGIATYYQTMCLIVNEKGETDRYSFCTKDSLEIYPFAWSVKPPVFLAKAGKLYKPSNFKQELIYNGKSNNVVKISYREFVNDLARPSFTQDIVYDLTESNIIGFKGMTIEVIEATNTSIKYKIKAPMR